MPKIPPNRSHNIWGPQKDHLNIRILRSGSKAQGRGGYQKVWIPAPCVYVALFMTSGMILTRFKGLPSRFFGNMTGLDAEVLSSRDLPDNTDRRLGPSLDRWPLRAP